MGLEGANPVFMRACGQRVGLDGKSEQRSEQISNTVTVERTYHLSLSIDGRRFWLSAVAACLAWSALQLAAWLHERGGGQKSLKALEVWTAR